MCVFVHVCVHLFLREYVNVCVYAHVNVYV